MSRVSSILIDGKSHRWKDILELRRAQLAAATPAAQLVLFEGLIEDYRPVDARTASGRYQEPGLFDLWL
jgi:hypothetical protein